MKIVFFGTPEFAAHILEDLVRHKIDIVAIVTKPDRPQGRKLQLLPPAVKSAAERLLPQVPVFQPQKCSTPEFVATLQKFNADLFVFVAYGEIIKQEVLQLPPLGCINVHASILPQYRGASPIRRCLLDGAQETGISIIQLVKEMDAGDVLYTEKLSIPEQMTFKELESALCTMGSRCLLKTLSDFEQGSVTRTPQDHTQATFAHKIPPASYEIDLKKSAREVHNLIRALSPEPGAWLYVTIRGQKKRLKVLISEVCTDEDISQAPGTSLPSPKNTLLVACGKGSIFFHEVQLEGKQKMAISDFLRGFQPLFS
jgi:methionyl-tRNA formyltransferase